MHTKTTPAGDTNAGVTLSNRHPRFNANTTTDPRLLAPNVVSRHNQMPEAILKLAATE
jgi:hypothetical protein